MSGSRVRLRRGLGLWTYDCVISGLFSRFSQKHLVLPTKQKRQCVVGTVNISENRNQVHGTIRVSANFFDKKGLVWHSVLLMK